jgi:drug/metabolite transporter (DMT)-like permease
MVAGHDRAETTNIWSGLVGSCVMLCLLPIYWTAPGRWEDWALFLSMGAVGGFAHYLLTKAFERGPAAVLSPFNYFQLLGATLTGWVLYSALPDGWTWAGASAIVAAGLAVARTERARRAGNGGRGA